LPPFFRLSASSDSSPLQDYITRGRSCKFLFVVERIVSNNGNADGDTFFCSEFVDLLTGLYQVSNKTYQMNTFLITFSYVPVGT
jgi:hypothetical protein